MLLLEEEVSTIIETLKLRLRQTANLKKFFCNKIKIMNREMFEPYDLL